MLNSVLLLRRGIAGASSLTSFRAPAGPAAAFPAAPGAGAKAEAGVEVESVTSAQRYRALRYGGTVRAAHSSTTCHGPAGASAVPRPAPRTAAQNDGSCMFRTDVDGDPATCGSGHARDGLPTGARPSSARLRGPAGTTLCTHTPGYDSDVPGLAEGLRHGRIRPGLRPVPRADAAWARAPLVAVDTKR